MKDLLLVVPSRGRPANLGRLWDAMQKTCRGDTTLLVGIDNDDPTWWVYPDGPQYVVENDLHQVVAWINHLAVPRTSDYRFIGHIGDDNVPLTDGWDVRIMEALEKTPFAFGNDLYPLRVPGSLCCHVFTRSEVIAALGYFGPPGFTSMYVDNVWMAWGNACGITYLDDVHIEHLHVSVGKAPMDDTYARSAAMMNPGLDAFGNYCQNQLATDIATIQTVI